MDRTTENGRLRRMVARVLALLALGAVIVAIVVVVGDSMDSSGDGKKGGERTSKEREQPKPDEKAETYVVQPNDTLVSISAETGVSVERLQQLNPQIDPQALPSGATLKLR